MRRVKFIFQLVELLLAMYEELGLLEELRIPREVLKKFLVRFGVHTYIVWLEGQLTLSEECAVHATKEGFPAQTKIGKSSGFSRGVSL